MSLEKINIEFGSEIDINEPTKSIRLAGKEAKRQAKKIVKQLLARQGADIDPSEYQLKDAAKDVFSGVSYCAKRLYDSLFIDSDKRSLGWIGFISSNANKAY